MAKLTVAQQKAKVAATIKVNGNKEITPPKDKIIRDDQLDSSPNWKDGGLQYESEVGYLTEFDVTDPKAFTPKKQVEEIVQQAISEIPTGDFLPRDGSLPMTGPLELSGDATQPLEAVPLQQAESIVEDAINEGNFLPRDGSLAMEGDLDLDNHVLKQMSYIRNFDGTWNKLLDFIGNTGALSVGVQNLLATIYSRQFFDALNKEYKLEVGDEDEGEYVRILLDLVNGFQFSTGQYYSRHNTNSYTANRDINWPNKGGTPAFLDDQATSLLLGLVKLYATTGANTDGPITQKGFTDFINQFLIYVPGKNKANKAEFVSNEYYNGTTFTFDNNSASSLKRTGFIEVKEGYTYHRSPSGSGGTVGYFDENQDPIGVNATQTATANGSYFTIPTGVKYIVANLPKNGAYDNTYQIEEGNIDTDYEAFQLVPKIDDSKMNVPSASKEIYERDAVPVIETVEASFGKTYKLNMIKTGSVLSTPGIPPHVNGNKAYISTTRTLGTASGTTHATDFLPVEEGRTYTTQDTGFTTQLTGGYFDKDKNSLFESIVGSLIPGHEAHNFTVPKGLGITYVVFNYAYSDVTVPGKIMMSEGPEYKTYEAYVEIDKTLPVAVPTNLKKVESDNGLDKININSIKYPGIWKKFPKFTSHWRKRDKDLVWACWGTSMLARTVDTDIRPLSDGTKRPPLADSYNLFSYLVDRLMWEGQQYRRYDASGFFTESGTFTKEFNNASWDDGAYREGRTSWSTSNGAYVQCVCPIGAYQFNFIYRSEAAGDPNCTVSITEGNGQMEVYNGSTWEEANGYVFSMVEASATSYKGNTTFQKRLKMRCKSGVIDSRASTKTVRVTKSSDTSKRLLYWGVEWSTREYMITFINAARGSHNFTSGSVGLPKFQENELYGFNPDHILIEPPTNNEGGATFSSIATKTRQSYVDVHKLWIFDPTNANSVWSKTNGLTTTEIALINTTASAGNNNFVTATKEWAFGTEATTGATICVADVFRYVGNWLNSISDQYAVVDLFEAWDREGRALFGNAYDYYLGSGASGKTFSQDGQHDNNLGAKVKAKYACPLYDFDGCEDVVDSIKSPLTSPSPQTSSNAIAVPDMSVLLKANTTYRVKGKLRINTAGGSGVKIGIVAPSGATIEVTLHGMNTGTSSFTTALLNSSASVGTTTGLSTSFIVTAASSGWVAFDGTIETTNEGYADIVVAATSNGQAYTIQKGGSHIEYSPIK